MSLINLGDTPIKNKISHVVETWDRQLSELKKQGKRKDIGDRKKYNEVITSLEKKKQQIQDQLGVSDRELDLMHNNNQIMASIQRLSKAIHETEKRFNSQRKE